ncbi:hypothetical protein Tco_1478995, partial [Tanacetum coccineum]
MKNCMPEAYKELVKKYEILERHYKDMMTLDVAMSIKEAYRAFSVFSILLLVLCDSSNFKTGIQAATALAVPL